MPNLADLIENNRRWAAASAAATPVLRPPLAPAGAALPVDRLRRQPRARQRDRRPDARRAVRPPQRGERRRALRSQLPVGAPVRGGGAARRARHRRAGTTAAAASRRRGSARPSA